MTTLEEHAATAEKHYRSLANMIKENGMTEPVEVNNVFKGMGMGGGMGGDGFGLGGLGGGGILGGLVLGSLLGNRNGGGGLFGGNGSGDGGSAVNQLTLSQVQATLGDIKASVPLAEAQVQLALAGTQAALSAQANADTLALLNQGTQSQLANANAFAQTGDKIDSVSTQLAVGFGVVNANADKNTFALAQIVNNDGDKTRALISSLETANANRRETILANELSDLKAAAARAADVHGISINMINNQNQNQLQFQAQQQVLTSLANALCEVGQVARATNQNLIIGNSGDTRTGAQTANPVNVRT